MQNTLEFSYQHKNNSNETVEQRLTRELAFRGGPGGGLPCEKKQVEIMRGDLARIRYKALDTSFLETSLTRTFTESDLRLIGQQHWNYPDQVTMQLPKWAVYSAHSEKPEFSLYLDLWRDKTTDPSKFNVGIKFAHDTTPLPAVFTKPLAAACGATRLSKHSHFMQWQDYYVGNITGELSEGATIYLSTHLNALIPCLTLEKLTQAKDVFHKNELFFAVPLIPEDYTVVRAIKGDPFLVGVYHNEAFLLDTFDASDYETFVEKRFSA